MKQLSLHDSTWTTLWKRQNKLYSDRKQIRGHLAGDREGTCFGVVLHLVLGVGSTCI